jgi:hypothetical protein
MNLLNRALVLMSAFVLYSSPHEAWAGPKYGPDATPISKRSNLEYFQKQKAADFWALIPYYVGQETGSQCSAANFSMVLNAARKDLPLTSADELVTIKSLLEKYTDDRYKNAMTGKFTLETFDRSNVANTRLAAVLGIAAEKLGIKTPKTQIDLVPIDFKDLKKSQKAFHDALVENEKSADDFIILTAFIQGKLTGDPEGGAHVATVGGYDAKKKLVLIMDPDRQWYEPYWSPEEKVFEAVADPKADHEKPGWTHFKIK